VYSSKSNSYESETNHKTQEIITPFTTFGSCLPFLLPASHTIKIKINKKKLIHYKLEKPEEGLGPPQETSSRPGS
jgi:hypothetical protein